MTCPFLSLPAIRLTPFKISPHVSSHLPNPCTCLPCLRLPSGDRPLHHRHSRRSRHIYNSCTCARQCQWHEIAPSADTPASTQCFMRAQTRRRAKAPQHTVWRETSASGLSGIQSAPNDNEKRPQGLSAQPLKLEV
jgi:hypothetical protein